MGVDIWVDTEEGEEGNQKNLGDLCVGQKEYYIQRTCGRNRFIVFEEQTEGHVARTE